MPRPFGCDGNDCDHDERGAWSHRAGCMGLLATAAEADEAVFDDSFAAYLLARGWNARPSLTF